MEFWNLLAKIPSVLARIPSEPAKIPSVPAWIPSEPAKIPSVPAWIPSVPARIPSEYAMRLNFTKVQNFVKFVFPIPKSPKS